MSKAHQARQFGRRREELPNSPLSLLTREEDLSAPREGRSSRLGKSPAESARPSELAGSSSGRAPDTSSQGSKKSFLEDDFFGQVPQEAIKAAEGSSASTNVQALLPTLQPRDDMEVDLLGSSNPGSGPGKRSAKSAGGRDCSGRAVKTPGKAQAPEKGEPVPGNKQPLAFPSASQQDKKFDLEDLADPLAGLLSDEEQDAPKKLAPTAPKSSSEKKAEESKEKEPSPTQTPLHSVTPVQKRKEIMFEVDSDDLIDMLGLGSGTQDKKSKQEKEEGWDDDDFVFGGHQRRGASTPRGRLGRRQSVRFSGESGREPTPEPGSEPAASMSAVRGRNSAADWLGLKEEVSMDLEPPFPAKASPAMSSHCRDTAGQPGPASQVPDVKEAAAKPSPAEEDDWLSSLLAQDKALGQAKAQERSAEPSEAPGKGLEHHSPIREELQPAHSRLDEFLGRGSVAKIPEDATTGERRDSPLDKKSKQEKEEGWDDDDFVFGGHQRRGASTPRGRLGRRQSVRFSGESGREPTPEPGSEPAASMSAVRGRNSAADWLGLKEEVSMDLEPPFPAKASPAMSSHCRDTAGQPGPASQVPDVKEAAAKPSPAEEDDWLSSLLAQDKALGQAKAQERSAEPSEAPGKGLEHHSPIREELQPAHSRLDEFLGRGSVAKIPEDAITGELRDSPLDKKSKQEKEEGWDDDDFVFGGHQRRGASTPRGRLGRRQSVRFSGESGREPTPEPGSEPAASMSAVRGRNSAADWLGLKEEVSMDLEPPFPAKASPAMSSHCRDTAGQPGPASQVPDVKEAAAKPSPAEEDDWLSSLLAQDKALGQAKAQERSAEPSEAPGKGLEHHSPISQPAASTAAPAQAAALPDQAASTEGSGQTVVPQLSTARQASAQAAKEDPSGDASSPVSMALTPGEQETQGLAPLAQVTTARAPTAQLCEDAAGCRAAWLSAQAHIAELEKQVRILELERTQQDLLLESLQHQHQEELNLLERTHRRQMKVLKDSYRQREERLQWEIEQLAAQMLTQSQDAERARAELVAQHQQQLAMMDQQNMLEMERVQELQRVSVQAMHRDHEEQIRRLKRQKDREVAALTSAISHTRSLHGVSEQMEISSSQQALLHKVEATQHANSRELATGPQQLEKQLHELQDRLLQHQRDMEEERSQLWEAVGRTESRLSDQTRLLQQLSSRQQENGEQHLPDTCRMQAEYQARLQAMQQHLEQLKQQEQHVHQEWMSKAQQTRQLGRLNKELPNSPMSLLTREEDLSVPREGHSSKLASGPLTAAELHRQASLVAAHSEEVMAVNRSAQFYISLIKLKQTALEDEIDIQNEWRFVESLKKAHSNTSYLAS